MQIGLVASGGTCLVAAILEWSDRSCKFMGQCRFGLGMWRCTLECVEGMGYTGMMRKFVVLALVAVMGLGLSGVGSSADADPILARYAEKKPKTFMRIYGPAKPPYGFMRFCDANPQYCADDIASVRATAHRFDATPERLSQLDAINRGVNDTVAPYTDQEIYGISEYWTMPTTRGDCEDYALLKREQLARQGWPRNALLLTVVRDELGEGHAVLTVRTRQGDFVLDNKVSDVRLWSEMPYAFVMRQSYVNPMVWVSLDQNYADDTGLLAGVSGNR